MKNYYYRKITIRQLDKKNYTRATEMENEKLENLNRLLSRRTYSFLPNYLEGNETNKSFKLLTLKQYICKDIFERFT
jgi:hypothetical protein